MVRDALPDVLELAMLVPHLLLPMSRVHVKHLRLEKTAPTRPTLKQTQKRLLPKRTFPKPMLLRSMAQEHPFPEV